MEDRSVWQRWGWRQKWRQCRRCHHTDKEGSKTDGAVCWVKPQDATAPPSTPSHQISRFKKESIPEPPTSSPMSVCFLLLDSELIFSARCVVLDMIQWLFEIGQRQIEALKKKQRGSGWSKLQPLHGFCPQTSDHPGSRSTPALVPVSLLAADIQSVHELARAEEPALKLKLATV